MYCREKRKLLAQIEVAVEAYRVEVKMVIQIDGVAPDDAMMRANDAYNSCQLSRTALRRHEREHGCSVTVPAYGRTA